MRGFTVPQVVVNTRISSRPARRWLRLALHGLMLALLLAVLFGCAPKENMLRETELLKARAGQIRATQKNSLELGGPICGLKELAIAESHRMFAIYELEQGHYPRFLGHVAQADDYLKLAWEQARRCEPPDRDGDGIPDHKDQCPDHPEDMDGFQDEDGCPDPDNDQDGIPDHLDRCPNDPETYTGTTDDDGCPEVTYKSIEVTEKEIRIKETIFFATNRAVILPQSFPLLDEVVQALNSHSTLVVEVGGHTDDVGNATYNKRLSQQRADAVRKYLVDKGIEASRLTAVGYGDEQPLESNRTAAGRAKNRRVEFKILSR